tara:strand:+ start:114 stop:326 length:213 start_codon:yes stop_codon:yes gene_type:complete
METEVRMLRSSSTRAMLYAKFVFLYPLAEWRGVTNFMSAASHTTGALWRKYRVPVAGARQVVFFSVAAIG